MKIAVITGGETAEREVSIRSAENVLKAIDFAETKLFTFPEESEKFRAEAQTFDLAIPIIHGLGGEDGSIQKFFKELGIPFIFSDASTHEIAIDKVWTKKVVVKLGINVPEETSSFPMFIKPRTGGSSVASKLCKTKEKAEEMYQANPGVDFMQETPIKGREFTAGVLEYHGQTLPLPVIEIIPKTEFFDFESKYNPNKLADEVCPAVIPEPLAEELQRQAMVVHSHLNARHITRSDFIVTSENEIYFLETNTIPGLTATSLVPKMLKAINLSLTDVLRDWCGLVNNKI